MNLSGISVQALVQELGIEDVSGGCHCPLRRACLPTRVRSRSSGAVRQTGITGVKSISGTLGTEDWIRVRIGVGKPALADGREIKAGGKDYLLAPMRKPELEVMDEVLDRVKNAVEVVLAKGVSSAMNEFNRRPDDPEKDSKDPKPKA